MFPVIGSQPSMSHTEGSANAKTPMTCKRMSKKNVTHFKHKSDGAPHLLNSRHNPTGRAHRVHQHRSEIFTWYSDWSSGCRSCHSCCCSVMDCPNPYLTTHTISTDLHICFAFRVCDLHKHNSSIDDPTPFTGQRIHGVFCLCQHSVDNLPGASRYVDQLLRLYCSQYSTFHTEGLCRPFFHELTP